MVPTETAIWAFEYRLAVEVAYEHQYKNLPVEGKGTTDAVTTVNLVFKF